MICALGTAVAYGYLAEELELVGHERVRAWSETSRQSWIGQRVYRFLRWIDPAPKVQPGLWRKAKPSHGATEEDKLKQLAAIGYLAGYEPATDLANVTRYLSGQAYDGLNLHTSGHAQEALLSDMEGNVLHRWSYEFREAFPNHPEAETRSGMSYWRRVHLFENGDLLAIYEGYGLIKLDRDSNLIWAKDCGCHHDLYVEESGRIHVLTREPKIVPRIHAVEPVLLDFVVVMSSEGEELDRISVLEAFEDSSYASFLLHAPPYGDLLHTNTIERLSGSMADRLPAFKEGNLLLSVREMDVIAVLDPNLRKIVWALAGQWRRQHQPTVLENGRILLLDNRGHHEMSKVIELDPLTQEILWAYEVDEKNGFSTRTGGSNQRLPNGNTLVTESDSGRAFELTSAKKIVWEYYNQARAGENDELVANLCEVQRLSPEFPVDWIREMDSGGAEN